MEIIFDISVIGAGPAGIITISELLEKETFKIAWIDPEFQ